MARREATFVSMTIQGQKLSLEHSRRGLPSSRGLRPGPVWRRGRLGAGCKQPGTGHPGPNPRQQLPPPTRPPRSEESGFNFLVSAKRRRKRTRRRRRKERAEALMRPAGICHSAHGLLTTQGSPSCKQPMIYGHRVNSCGRNQP